MVRSLWLFWEISISLREGDRMILCMCRLEVLGCCVGEVLVLFYMFVFCVCFFCRRFLVFVVCGL